MIQSKGQKDYPITERRGTMYFRWGFPFDFSNPLISKVRNTLTAGMENECGWKAPASCHALPVGQTSVLERERAIQYERAWRKILGWVCILLGVLVAKPWALWIRQLRFSKGKLRNKTEWKVVESCFFHPLYKSFDITKFLWHKLCSFHIWIYVGKQLEKGTELGYDNISDHVNTLIEYLYIYKSVFCMFINILTYL